MIKNYKIEVEGNFRNNIKEIYLGEIDYAFIIIYFYNYLMDNYSVDKSILHAEIKSMFSELQRLSLHTNFDFRRRKIGLTINKFNFKQIPSLLKTPETMEEFILRADNCKDIVRNILEKLEEVANKQNDTRLLKYLRPEIDKFKSKTMCKELRLLTAIRNSYAHRVELKDPNMKKVEIDSNHIADFTGKVFGAKIEEENNLIINFTKFNYKANNPEQAEIREYFKIPKKEINNSLKQLYFILYNLNKKLKENISLEYIDRAFSPIGPPYTEQQTMMMLSHIGLVSLMYQHDENKEYKQ
ncbi:MULTISPECIES: hypothetical protein [Lactococcus]|jgi:hypothetical protein|uniref:Uncharacterized protein n=1 Tax=Lactococcus formosensis TaxID=1281486 RepID=A0A9Q9D7M8_9LACT|nr:MULTISPECIES: hypothetical protein [Lactococcus]USI66573.1 hypothetical protein LMK05_04650 [Lactococcus petauri]USI69017.1 hypothetical protein LMK04_04580 [Lactococcus petauri]USJ21204.1 hypothetical protein LMK00_04155 [Lactococcus formosensis]WJE13684.1 hypothetical protein QR692_04550 [Lactococcus petauri]